MQTTNEWRRKKNRSRVTAAVNQRSAQNETDDGRTGAGFSKELPKNLQDGNYSWLNNIWEEDYDYTKTTCNFAHSLKTLYNSYGRWNQPRQSSRIIHAAEIPLKTLHSAYFLIKGPPPQPILRIGLSICNLVSKRVSHYLSTKRCSPTEASLMVTLKNFQDLYCLTSTFGRKLE